ncbi:LysM peptidoglycan-binding domain-containing protein [Nocardioides sp. NPDC006303]|uniref:LysM peptidoglycan-binding domain-containing protein n=1 Tax=Nocardioides sp. NPDC006303 TaxID=3156747 RepID=UPI0033AAE4FD
MIATRVWGLLASLAILALLVGAPAVLLLLGAVPTLEGLTWRDLLRQDDGALALQAVTAAAWIAWAWLAVTILLEVTARLRSTRTPRLPGLPQTTATRLVGTAALLFIAVPAAAPTLTPARAAATPPIPETPPQPATTQVVITPAQAAPELDQPSSTVPYTVKRGDSLWRIAETYLGAGTRFTEIIDLNPDALGGHADFLPIGLVLRLPAPAPQDTDDEMYVVRPGDTIAEIAATELNDPDRYPEIFEASRITTQAGGAHLTDPDVIQPGWTLTIPSPDSTQEESRVPTRDTPERHEPPIRTPEAKPVVPTPTPPSPARASTPEHADEYGDAEPAPSWLLPGLAGAGAVLTGGLMLLLRQHHRSQRRHRLPGHEITTPPPGLRPAEKSIHFEGISTATLIEHLDALLRMLPNQEQPHLLAAELGHGRITLHLTAPAALPHPWTGGPTIWVTDGEAATTGNGDNAPYPLLASIGQSDDGHLWLLNLEEIKIINLTGDHERAEALGRHLAAELTVTPWSMLVQVDTQSLAPELTGLDPLRLHHHDHPDSLLPLAADLDATGRLPGFDPDRYHAIIAAQDSEPIRTIAKTIASDHDRSGAAVVVLDAVPDLDATKLTITTDGRLTIAHPTLQDVGLIAAGITPEEATTCAAIVEAARGAEDRPMPRNESATNGMEALIDAAGALRPEYVHERSSSGRKPAGHDSLLPAPTETYVAQCATTRDDVNQLAPVVDTATRDTVATLDRTLDDDVAEWLSPQPRLPKLTLLGPVHLRACGAVPPARRPYFAELLGYLTLHPDGVRTDEFLDAIGISRSRLTIDLGKLRNWLGKNPRTGKDHLQDARKTRASQQLGYPAYQAEDVLVDLDLFRRLRTRGQARGAEGITDLDQALRLVTGEPFSQLRDKGWSWLLDDQRHDHIAVSMIVDTAHLVVNRALTEGQHDMAREAAEIASKAAPYDDIPHLDFSRILSATGHPDLAEEHIAEHIYSRDDGEGPAEPPARSRRAAR